MLCAEKGLEQRLAEIAERLREPPLDANELLPLLDKTEKLLAKVEQSPSESMSTTLHPIMKGFISKELLWHPDADVRLSLTTCISEITRITAPDSPYDDELMKIIFQMIVKAFEKLNDVSGHLYSKRVSILETVAKVRSCVLMLDLDSDPLILDMFRHFLRTIRDDHPSNISSAMEVIMTLILEESEDITTQLLSLLLSTLKKGRMDVLPVSRKLAEKVISNSSLKLKPCLMSVVQSLGAPPNDYGPVVAAACHGISTSLIPNKLDNSADHLFLQADDSRISERTVSDELAQGSGKMEAEVSCPEMGTVSVRSPKSVVSNAKHQDDKKLTGKKKTQASDVESSKSEIPLKKRGRKARVSENTPTKDIEKQKDRNSEDQSVKSTSGKKRARNEEFVPSGHEENLKFDESLVGRKIKVWWPDDAKFYPGVVESYNPNTKKHKVMYLDGDKETLLLKHERFEFIGAAKKDEDSTSSHDTSSKTSEKKNKKKKSEDDTSAPGNDGKSASKSVRKPRDAISSPSNSGSGKVSSAPETAQS